jgi:hypothetical protein
VVPPTGTSADIEAVLTMCPPSPCARMRGRIVTMPLIVPPRLTFITQSQSAKVASSVGPTTATPALLPAGGSCRTRLDRIGGELARSVTSS